MISRLDPLGLMGDGSEKGGGFILCLCAAIALPFALIGEALNREWPEEPDGD
jgi:hypothetical protein